MFNFSLHFPTLEPFQSLEVMDFGYERDENRAMTMAFPWKCLNVRENSLVCLLLHTREAKNFRNRVGQRPWRVKARKIHSKEVNCEIPFCFQSSSEAKSRNASRFGCLERKCEERREKRIAWLGFMFSKKAEVESRPKIVAMASDFMIGVRSVDHATCREIQLRGFRTDDCRPMEPVIACPRPDRLDAASSSCRSRLGRCQKIFSRLPPELFPRTCEKQWQRGAKHLRKALSAATSNLPPAVPSERFVNFLIDMFTL